MTEARYRGQKVIAVSPDYAVNTKFADEWLAPHPGTDGAMAMAMGHVILKEFFVDRQVPRFADYVTRFTDLPFLVTLREHGDAGYVPDRFLTAADLGDTGEGAAWKTVVLDAAAGRVAVPNGSLGFRHTASGEGRWNLDLEGIDPLLSLAGPAAQPVAVSLPRFDTGGEGGSLMSRGVPARRVAGHLVTTVFDLMLAQYGVARDGLPGSWPAGYDDPEPYTPAWQEPITSVPAAAVARIAREFADNAERSGGRSMITLGAGTNHWFHSDQIYRAILALVVLTGCEGVNGGGWAHYVGQEKCRPFTGGRSSRSGSTGSARPARWPAPRTGTWPPANGDTTGSGPLSWHHRSAGAGSPAGRWPTASCRPAGWAGSPPTRRSTATRWRWPTPHGHRSARPGSMWRGNWRAGG
jgi:nitrate reductase alpha subunit